MLRKPTNLLDPKIYHNMSVQASREQEIKNAERIEWECEKILNRLAEDVEKQAKEGCVDLSVYQFPTKHKHWWYNQPRVVGEEEKVNNEICMLLKKKLEAFGFKTTLSYFKCYGVYTWNLRIDWSL